MEKEIKKETLIVNGWNSQCGNCNLDCSPEEKQHLTNLGYNEEVRKKKGCNIKWKYITSSCGIKEIRKRMDREDLQEIDFFSL